MGGSSAGGKKVTRLALVTREARVLWAGLGFARQLLSFDAKSPCLSDPESFRLSILPATQIHTQRQALKDREKEKQTSSCYSPLENMAFIPS